MLVIGELVIAGAVGLLLALLFVSLDPQRRKQRKQKETVAYPDEYEPIRRRIESRFKRRGEFALHVVLYLFIGLALWFLVPIPRMAALWLTAAWGLVVVLHLVRLLFAEAQERAVDREIDRIRGQEASKPKRHRHLQIGEDGELVEINDSEPQFYRSETP